MTKSRWLRVLALLLGLSLIAAACGDDDGDTEAAPDTEDDGGEETPDEGEESDCPTEGVTELDIDIPVGEGNSGGTVVFASDQEPDGWNINTSSSNLLALGQLTQAVLPWTFRTTPDFEVVMDDTLLVSAEQVSDEPQVIEYVIQPDAVWSDGTPITADDFEFQWMMQNGSDTCVDTATTTGYDRIESVEGSEEGKTVTVTYSEPYSEWQSLFTNMLPAHLVTEAGGGDPVVGWNEAFDGDGVLPFSGGPFILTDYSPEQSVTLVPNGAYWGETAELDEIVIRFDVDNSGIPAALENDEIDMAYPQPQLDLVDQIDSIDGVDSQISFGLQFEHIDFNLANSHLAKLEVRQAIAKALDRPDLVARTVGQFSDQAEVLNNRIWLNTLPQYVNNAEGYETQSLEEAGTLLADAGYDCSGDVCTHPEDGDLSLRISTTGGNALRENTQLVIQNQLAAAGIDIVIDNVEGGAVFEKFFPESNLLADQDYDIALFAWVGTPFPSSNKALYSTDDPTLVNSNNTGYMNDEIVDIFDQALVETDAAVATDLYNQADSILWSDMPTVPLYQKPTFLPFRSSIANVIDNASTAGPLWNAYDWTVG